MDLTPLIQPADSKLLLLVLDGLGGYADAEHGTELEEATAPHLDALAAEGTSGLCEPVGPGITPGSGPGHLGLFGYDPEVFELGRGALSAAGLDVELRAGDVAARGNLCTIAPDGTIADRRAGRVPDDEARLVIDKLEAGVHIDGVEIVFRHEREHRCLVVLRGDGLDPHLGDTDPQQIGVAPLDPEPRTPEAKRTAEIVAELAGQARTLLADEPKANGLLLRGFDTHRELPQYADRYGLRAAAIAVYPMYRGIARLLGMDVLGAPTGLDDQLGILRDAWNDYDYFFFHHKGTDSAGEDGDRPRKIAAIEALDSIVPQLRDLGPDVIAVTGDHSTPSQMAAHSWHPVPTLVWSERCGRDSVEQFGERWCRHGDLGIRPMKDLMAFMLANAGRLQKYGA
ncbi:MAG: 2,3-bisphosphoglycerate-independent phosphoglycerate mutase [Acidimicrobiia bacterium]|jgi:2,3-bisphosphoglycerate-independent phosphoglycerate mutase|nr:2,3-bisphosphoglycerate-independent phosphoglycerate mutase [Acidimicrobiia bacterium]